MPLLCWFLSLQTSKRNIPMLFVRGDGVILVSPPVKVGAWVSFVKEQSLELPCEYCLLVCGVHDDTTVCACCCTACCTCQWLFRLLPYACSALVAFPSHAAPWGTGTTVLGVSFCTTKPRLIIDTRSVSMVWLAPHCATQRGKSRRTWRRGLSYV